MKEARSLDTDFLVASGREKESQPGTRPEKNVVDTHRLNAVD